METELDAEIEALITTCECVIRRGEAPTPATLHTFQQQLVTARDAPSRAQTTDHLQTAIQYYRETIPKETQTTILAELTNEVHQLDTHLQTAVDSSHATATDTGTD